MCVFEFEKWLCNTSECNANNIQNTVPLCCGRDSQLGVLPKAQLQQLHQCWAAQIVSQYRLKFKHLRFVLWELVGNGNEGTQWRSHGTQLLQCLWWLWRHGQTHATCRLELLNFECHTIRNGFFELFFYTTNLCTMATCITDSLHHCILRGCIRWNMHTRRFQGFHPFHPRNWMFCSPFCLLRLLICTSQMSVFGRATWGTGNCESLSSHELLTKPPRI